jgi:hypothetical protein
MRPEQEEFVAPVAWSLAEAYASPEIARPRLVRDGEAVVGFVMGGFDPQSPADRGDDGQSGRRRDRARLIPAPAGRP